MQIALPCRPYEDKSGIGEYRRAGIAHQDYRIPSPKSFQRQRQTIRFVVLMIASQSAARNDPCVVQKLACPTGILGEDQLGSVEDFPRPGGEIVEGADGRGNDPKSSTRVHWVVMIPG